MASIKHLKLHLKYLIDNVKDECILYLAIHPETKAGSIAEIIREIDAISSDLLFGLNHCKNKPSELSAKQYVNLVLADARKKMDTLFVKLPVDAK